MSLHSSHVLHALPFCRSVKKVALRLIETMVDKCEDPDLVAAQVGAPSRHANRLHHLAGLMAEEQQRRVCRDACRPLVQLLGAACPLRSTPPL